MRKIRIGQTTELSPDRIKPIVSDRAAPPPIEPPAQTEAEEETTEEIPDWVSELSGKSVVTMIFHLFRLKKNHRLPRKKKFNLSTKKEGFACLAFDVEMT